MTVTPIESDAVAPARAAGSLGGSFRDAVAAAGGAFERADRSEQAFVAGRGGLLPMIVDRAQADIVLSIASAAASRAVQSVSTIFNMQV